MSRLYLANPTRQNQVVCYRLDYNKHGDPEMNRRFQPARQQDIAPGRQIQLGGDFHKTQIEDIVDQLSRYGLVGVVDIQRGEVGGKVVPYIYNIDAPVPAEAMRKVQAMNSSILIEQGRLRRQKAAVATNEIVQTTVAHEFLESGIDERPSDRIAVSFEQEERSEAGEKRIAEGYRVGPEGPKPKGGKGRRN